EVVHSLRIDSVLERMGLAPPGAGEVGGVPICVVGPGEHRGGEERTHRCRYLPASMPDVHQLRVVSLVLAALELDPADAGQEGEQVEQLVAVDPEDGVTRLVDGCLCLEFHRSSLTSPEIRCLEKSSPGPFTSRRDPIAKSLGSLSSIYRDQYPTS